MVNFIIQIWRHLTTTCSFVEPFLTTCYSEVAVLGNYEIHSMVNKDFESGLLSVRT